MTTLGSNEIKILSDKISLCKWKLIKQFPFFGILALKFKYSIDDAIGTAGTDGTNIIFSSKFLKDLSLPELKWVVAHEIMHVSNGHLRRRNGRDAKIFNIAADYAIHDILKGFEDSEFRMPSGEHAGLYDEKYHKMSAEQIYDLLLKNAKKVNMSCMCTMDNHDEWDKEKSSSGDKDGKGDKGTVVSGHGVEDNDMSEQEWEQLMISAAKQHQGKSCGNLPAYLKDLLIKLKPPKKDWRQLLNEFVSPIINDYSFNPPDKRMYSVTDCMLPDFNDEAEEVKNIVFWIDISGSMSEKEIVDVYSEVVGAINQFSSMTGWLGYFDTDVHNVDKFEDVQDVLKNKPKSGGGTDFKVCFEAVQNSEHFNLDNVAGIVVMTDGEASFDECEKLSAGISTLWIMTTEHCAAPFGTTVYLEDKKNSDD